MKLVAHQDFKFFTFLDLMEILNATLSVGKPATFPAGAGGRGGQISKILRARGPNIKNRAGAGNARSSRSAGFFQHCQDPDQPLNKFQEFFISR